MLRVGLTGGLGSGKTTIAQIFARLGAFVIAADEVGRRLMQPGERVYAEIIRTFGDGVLRSDGSLDRKALAQLAFGRSQPQSQELNRIVHPATVAAEKKWMDDVFSKDPSAIAIVESALIFEVEKWGTAPGWMEQFDVLILVRVPDDLKITRFVSRMAAAGADAAALAAWTEDARARLATQIPDEEKSPLCDYVIDNTCPLDQTRRQVEEIYAKLRERAAV